MVSGYIKCLCFLWLKGLTFCIIYLTLGVNSKWKPSSLSEVTTWALMCLIIGCYLTYAWKPQNRIACNAKWRNSNVTYYRCGHWIKTIKNLYFGCQKNRKENLQLIVGKCTKFRKCTKYQKKASLHNEEPHCGHRSHYTLMGCFVAIGPISYWLATLRPLASPHNNGPVCGLFPEFRVLTLI